MTIIAALIIFLGLQLPAGMLAGRFLRFSHPQVFSMSTPNPLSNGLPVTGHNVLNVLAHEALVDVSGPLSTYFAAMQAASKAGVSADMATLKTQLVGNMIAAAPHLFGDVLGELFGIANYGLSKGVAQTAAKMAPAAPATPAS